MRRPAKIDGIATGNCSFHSRVHREADAAGKRSRCAGVADFSPNSVLAMIGNSEMSTQITTRLVSEKPSLSPTIGAMATNGTVCRITA